MSTTIWLLLFDKHCSTLRRQPHNEVVALVLVGLAVVAVMAVVGFILSYGIIALELGSLLRFYLLAAVSELFQRSTIAYIPVSYSCPCPCKTL